MRILYFINTKFVPGRIKRIGVYIIANLNNFYLEIYTTYFVINNFLTIRLFLNNFSKEIKKKVYINIAPEIGL